MSTKLERASAVLPVLERAERMLAEASTVEEVVQLRDELEAVRVMAKQVRAGTGTINRASLLKALTMRKLANLVDSGQANGTIATQQGGRPAAKSIHTMNTFASLNVGANEVHAARLLRNYFTDEELNERYERVSYELPCTRLMVEARAMHREREATSRTLDTAPPSYLGEVFPLVYCDPPWVYEHTTPSRRIENNYPTMSGEELAALDIPAATDCVLFMWCTAPKLEEGIDLINAWGFRYRTCAVWVKEKLGMGFWWRSKHEHLLCATRGDISPPVPSRRDVSVFSAPMGKHSEKPPMHDTFDRMFPGMRKVELFARTKPASPWWQAWGNDEGLAP